jgi:hypothetical protein
MDSISIAALTGGLAGAVVNIIWQLITGYWLRPQIEILFDNEEPGCCIETVGDPVRRYIRLKIINSGRSTAHGVAVCTTRLTFQASGVGSRTFAEEVFDLKLSHHNDIDSFFLAPGAHRYVDLAHTTQRGEGDEYQYDFHQNLQRLRVQGFGSGPGSYGAEIFVSSENAKAKRRVITWSWDGAFRSIRIITISGK